MIYYLLSVGLCWFIFYSLYEILLARLTFFNGNRFYLLATLLLGLILPLTPAMNFGALDAIESTDEPVLLSPIVVTMQAAEQSIEEIVVTPIIETSTWHWEDGMLLIYFIGVLIAGIRFVIGIERIFSLRKTGFLEKRNGFVFVKTNKRHLPFSFFNYLFWSADFVVDPNDEERIIHHELAHIQQGHSLDVLLLEVIKIFFWFIPFVYLYKKAITEIHEYLADAAVINTFQKKKQYGLLLLRQTQSGHGFALANHFIHSQLKKRLQMMTRSQTRYSAIWKYALILPLVGMLSYVFAQHQSDSNPLETIHVVGYDQDNTQKTFDPEQVLADFKADLNTLRSNSSEKAQHDAYNLFSARYVKLMTNYTEHSGQIKSLAEKALSEFNAPFAIKETSGNYDFSMVIPNWVTEKSTINLYSNAASSNSSEEVFKVVEEMPRFKGCEDISDAHERKKCAQKKMLVSIYSNIKYPKIARASGIQGTVIVDFMITKEGKVADLKLVREIGGGCGDEALRIISQMPDWIPGKQRGKNVNVRFVLPIKYKLDGGNKQVDSGKDYLEKIKRLDKDSKLLIIIDDKESSHETLKAMHPSNIEKIDVYKGEKAFGLYGEKAKNGVILVTTKNFLAQESPNALYIVDGKESTKAFVDQMDKSTIATINVYKGNVAAEKYGDKSANGVVEVVTKKFSSKHKIKNSEAGEETFMVVEEMPRFPGCEDITNANERKMCAQKKMLEFIYSNIKYPKEASEKGIEGTTVVRFVVDKSGEIRDAELVRDVGGGCGDAAITVVDMMPRWIPGKQRGKKVSVYYNLPIKFKLTGGDKGKETETSDTKSTPVQLEKSLQLKQFQAFPNPAEDQLTISFTGEKQATTIRLIDASGKELFRDEQLQFSGSYSKQLSLKGMARGAVFLQIIQGDAKYVEQIVLK